MVSAVLSNIFLLCLIFIGSNNAFPSQEKNDLLDQLIGKFGRLESQIHQLTVENEQLKIDVDRMTVENRQFKLELKQIKSDKIKRDTTARTCGELKLTDPSLPTGDYYIDPDGANVGEDAILVHCDMITDGGTTIIHHDTEAVTDVGKCAPPGCYSTNVTYNVSFKQVTTLADVSENCRQLIRYDCYDAALEFQGTQFSWWNDRNGREWYFWAGKNTNNNQHTCQCGISNVCADPNVKCNCDALASVQAIDSGYVTDKDLLPVTRLNFGRTALGNADGKHTLGPLQCSGRKIVATVPTNCLDLSLNGNQVSGFYLVKSTSSNQIQTVYCDFSQGTGTLVVGYNDLKTAPVYFYVQRNSSYTINSTVVPYQFEQLNIGGAMNITSGVFTVPVSGRYLFSFVGRAFTTETYVFLRVNGGLNTIAYGSGLWFNFPITATLNLKKNDLVDVYLYGGALYDSPSHYTQFTGMLLEEDIVASKLFN